MDEATRWHIQKRAERTIKALKDYGFHAEYFPERESAREWILEAGRDTSSIGMGGSMTIRELGLGGLPGPEKVKGGRSGKHERHREALGGLILVSPFRSP